MRVTPKTIDEYLAALPTDRHEALEKLRKTIKAIVPRAEECISYSMPVSAEIWLESDRAAARCYALTNFS
jgi:hypothetical protein